MTQTGVDMKALGLRVKEARTRKGYNQAEAARIIGMNLPTYWHIEAGNKPHIRSDTIYKLCRALGVSADYLLGLSGAAAAEPDAAGELRGRPRQAVPAPAGATG